MNVTGLKGFFEQLERDGLGGAELAVRINHEGKELTGWIHRATVTDDGRAVILDNYFGAVQTERSLKNPPFKG